MFCCVYGTWTTTANFSYFHLELNPVNAHLAQLDIFRAIGVLNRPRQLRISLVKYKFIFDWRRPRRRRRRCLSSLLTPISAGAIYG